MPKSSMGIIHVRLLLLRDADSFINSQLIVLCHIIGGKVTLQWLSSNGGEGSRKEERGELIVVDGDKKNIKKIRLIECQIQFTKNYLDSHGHKGLECFDWDTFIAVHHQTVHQLEHAGDEYELLGLEIIRYLGLLKLLECDVTPNKQTTILSNEAIVVCLWVECKRGRRNLGRQKYRPIQRDEHLVVGLVDTSLQIQYSGESAAQTSSCLRRTGCPVY